LPANKPEALGADKLAPQLAKTGKVGELSIDRAFLDSELAHGLEAGAGRVVCRAPGTHATERYGKKLFTIDLAAGTVTCPAGQQARIDGTDARFASPTCNTCPQRDRCLPPRPRQGRRITIAPYEARNQRLAAEEKTPAGRARVRSSSISSRTTPAAKAPSRATAAWPRTTSTCCVSRPSTTCSRSIVASGRPKRSARVPEAA
jgi:hypothetical protein